MRLFLSKKPKLSLKTLLQKLRKRWAQTHEKLGTFPTFLGTTVWFLYAKIGAGKIPDEAEFRLLLANANGKPPHQYLFHILRVNFLMIAINLNSTSVEISRITVDLPYLHDGFKLEFDPKLSTDNTHQGLYDRWNSDQSRSSIIRQVLGRRKRNIDT